MGQSVLSFELQMDQMIKHCDDAVACQLVNTERFHCCATAWSGKWNEMNFSD